MKILIVVILVAALAIATVACEAIERIGTDDLTYAGVDTIYVGRGITIWYVHDTKHDVGIWVSQYGTTGSTSISIVPDSEYTEEAPLDISWSKGGE